MMPIKVLIVDDSNIIRQIFSSFLEEDNELQIVGCAPDGKDALEKIATLKPDVVTLDVEMPVMNGLDCLAKIMEKNPLPVVMVSYLTTAGAEATIKALELGAVDFVSKPLTTDKENLRTIQAELIQKIKVAAEIKITTLKGTQKTSVSTDFVLPSKLKTDLEVLAIGSSTGGPRALNNLLTLFPRKFPIGVIVAQHMPKDFTQIFAKRLNDVCELEVIEAKSGDEIRPGRVLIAPSGRQAKVIRYKESLLVEVFDQANLIYKPSIDLLFKSIALTCQGKVLSILLTGMGSDGAAGMQELRKLGARTIAEAEESCVVFGMPRAAIEMGGAEYVESLPNIFPRILDIIA